MVDEDTRQELIRMAKAFEKELEKIETIDDASNFVEDVLAIERMQAFVDNGWETSDYILTVAYGGPTMQISTAGVISGGWSLVSIEYPVSDKAKKGLDLIYEYLHGLESNQ